MMLEGKRSYLEGGLTYTTLRKERGRDRDILLPIQCVSRTAAPEWTPGNMAKRLTHKLDGGAVGRSGGDYLHAVER